MLVELMVAARSPARSAAAIWSRISASSGETTSVGPPPCDAQGRGRRPVDRRLAPAGGLHDQHPAPVVDQLGHRPQLVLAGRRVRAGHRGDGPAEGVLAGEGEGAVDCHARHSARPHPQVVTRCSARPTGRTPSSRARGARACTCVSRPDGALSALASDGRGWADGRRRRTRPQPAAARRSHRRDLRRSDPDRRRPVRGRGPRGRAGRSDADHPHHGRPARATRRTRDRHQRLRRADLGPRRPVRTPARPDRSAGDQGRRRDLRGQHGGAGDRGAGGR